MSFLTSVNTNQLMAVVRFVGNRSGDPRLFSADDTGINGLPWLLRTAIRSRLVQKGFRCAFESRLPGGIAYITAKSRVFDDWISEACRAEPDLQLVILGAGLDTRAARLSAITSRIRVIEIDQPEAIAAKQRWLDVTNLDHSSGWVRYVEARLGEAPPSLSWLERIGIDTTRPTLFLLDGLSYFLEPKLLRCFLSVAGKFPKGSQLLFDYAYDEIFSGTKLLGSAEFLAELERVGEPARCGIDPAEISQILSTAGFHLRRRLGPEELKSSILRDATGAALEPYGFLELVQAEVQ